ncbi:hypothetical protein ACFLUU_04985 [Chloroflexota bacterium]
MNTRKWLLLLLSTVNGTAGDGKFTGSAYAFWKIQAVADHLDPQ